MNCTIYHNPRCSKSRQTLSLLEAKKLDIDIVLYLENTPGKSQIKTLLKQLNMTARELLRKNEDAYKEAGLADASLSESAIIDAMVTYPKLIERPIVVCGDKAVIGRPPERIEELF